MVETWSDRDMGNIVLNHGNRKDLLYDMDILNRWREVRGLFKKYNIGRHVIFLGFRRVTSIPFLKT